MEELRYFSNSSSQLTRQEVLKKFSKVCAKAQQYQILSLLVGYVSKYLYVFVNDDVISAEDVKE